MPTKYPADKITWRKVKSKNVTEIGWDKDRHLYAKFLSGDLYLYQAVSRQRAVACSRAKSVGSYIARVIAPNHTAVKIA